MDFIRKLLFEADVMNQRVRNPKTGVELKVSAALQYPDSHPVKQAALALIAANKEKSKPIPKEKKEPIQVPSKIKPKPIIPLPTDFQKPSFKNDLPKKPGELKTTSAIPKKNERSHKPKSKSYGISKECVEFLKSKGLTGLNVLPQSFVTIDQIQINPEIKTKGKDAVWVAKFPVMLPNGKESLKLAYTREFMKKSQAVKYKKISKIKEKDITSLEEKTNKLLLNKNRIISDAACVLAIILKTGLRVGSSDSDVEGGTGNLGVRTLRKENINIKGDKIGLNFIGKSYQENTAVFNSKEIAGYLSNALKTKKDMDDVFSCSYGQVNALMAQINPKGITPKDLRTYKATEFAKKLLQSKELGAPPPLPDNPREIKKIVKEKLNKVFIAVSQLLNNSPTMARNSYVHPVVITSFLDSLGLKPEHAGYKHITLESINIMETPKFLSMDQMFDKYKDNTSNESEQELTEDINSDINDSDAFGEYDDCEEYEIPNWFFDPNIVLVRE